MDWLVQTSSGQAISSGKPICPWPTTNYRSDLTLSARAISWLVLWFFH